MSIVQPRRGEVWLLSLDPTLGHEQGGRRPALVVSLDAFNRGAHRLAVIVPLTRTPARTRWHLPLQPPEGGLRAASTILCEQVRIVSVADRFSERWGVVTPATMAAVAFRLRLLLDL